MKRNKIGWGAVIVCMWLFFPLGIWMLANKVTAEKHLYLENGKALKNFGVFLVFFGIIFLILSITGVMEFEDESNAAGITIVMVLIFVMGGAIAYLKGNQYITRGLRYDQCKTMLASGAHVELDSVAADLKLTYSRVSADIRTMIEYGYFANAEIDEKNHLMIKKAVVRPTRILNCQCCGGKNEIVVGEPAKCAYCDSPL